MGKMPAEVHWNGWGKKVRKKYTSGPRYWNVPVLVNTGTFLVYQYCLKMWYLYSLECACWCYSEAYNTGTQKWSSIVQYSCTSIWNFKYTFSKGSMLTNNFVGQYQIKNEILMIKGSKETLFVEELSLRLKKRPILSGSSQKIWKMALLQYAQNLTPFLPFFIN